MVLHDIEGGRVDQFLLEVQMGHIPGAYIRWVYAQSALVSSTMSDIWELGGTYIPLTTAQQLYVWSTSASDVGKPLFISGLDANYNLQEETVILNGTNVVPTTKQWLRACYTENGDGSLFIGNIYVSRVSGSILSSDVVNHIDPKFQHSTQSCLTVPAGKTAFLFHGEASAGKNRDISTYFKARKYTHSYITLDMMDLYQNTVSVRRPFISFKEKTDLKVSATSSVSNTTVSIGYGVLILDNAEYNLPGI